MFKRKNKEQEAMETQAVNEKPKKRFFFQREEGEKPEKIPLTPEQKKKRKKRLIIGAVVVVLLALNIIPKMFAPEVLPTVSVAEAYQGMVEQTIEGSGDVKSERVKTYFSPVSATVSEFELQVGDTVEAGATLLTYDGAELDELYQQAELTGSAAGFGYQDAITRDNKNVSEFNRSSQALGIIEQQLEDEKNENEHVQDRITEYTGKQGDAQMVIGEQQAIAADAQSRIDQAERDKLAAEEELKKLAAEAAAADANAAPAPDPVSGTAPADSADEAADQAAKEQAEKEQAAKEQAAKDRASKEAEQKGIIENAEKVIKEQTAIRDAALEKIREEQSKLNEISEKLNGYQDRLKDSTENLEKLQTSKAKEEGIKDSSEASKLTAAARSELATNNNLSNLNAQMTKDDINEGKAGIQAEFSGVVTEVTAVPGGPAAKGGSLFTVASNEDVIVDMSVTRFDLEKLEVGQMAEINLAGKTYTGQVSKLSRLAEDNSKGTPVVSAEIHIDNPDENIYLGLEAKVTVSGRKVENVIVVPVEAVNTGVDGSFCYVVDETGVVVRKDVETGLASATEIEISAGLNAGDKVIRNTGGMLLEEGMRVTAVEE
ncbi:MAG: efflux RND transporter periplasmic adaptor subunit [Lachnospiraceae bacterium]|jgi:HlyD family secretion protein|nr:efflux RND transporter periplasmic adaptor subunit [Lachnospiraceae bacterium]